MVSFKKMAVRICGGLGNETIDFFKSIKRPLDQSNIKILFRTYVSIIIFSSILTFISLSLTVLIVFYFLLEFNLVWVLSGSFLAGMTGSMVAFFLMYFYPIQKASHRKKSIVTNLPFAINHMAAVASSGVPPYIIFKLLTEFKEYGEISMEAKKVVRNIDTFGQDITSSIRQVADESPSREFSEFLKGIVSTVETGGNLEKYLKNRAKEALFNYKLKREEYMESLSTYADFYTAVLIAAPLFLIALLAVMNMLEGQFGGISLSTTCPEGVSLSLQSVITGTCSLGIMELGVYLFIPLLNTIFIAFIHFTQPEVA
ncbi:MAG: type II secretion system F family protein [Candidatus Aenigmatarchaeota archaeon]